LSVAQIFTILFAIIRLKARL